MPEPRRVILTDQAIAELESIAGYIRQDSPQNAAAVAEVILHAIDSLGTLSERFRCVGKSRKRGSPIHAMVVPPFIIYYRIDASAVHVLSVLHGARKQPRGFR